jgi:hypothetical protein
MSKKSRKRNRKILKALAVGLGAAALMRGRRNKAIDAGIASADADKGSDMLPESKNWITKKNVAAPVESTVIAPQSSNFQTRFKSNRNPKGVYMGPNETRLYNESLPGAGVDGPPSVLNPYSSRNIRGGRLINRKDGGRASHKSGGSVKGVGKAKRGFGRALKKGK